MEGNKTVGAKVREFGRHPTDTATIVSRDGELLKLHYDRRDPPFDYEYRRAWEVELVEEVPACFPGLGLTPECEELIRKDANLQQTVKLMLELDVLMARLTSLPTPGYSAAVTVIVEKLRYPWSSFQCALCKSERRWRPEFRASASTSCNTCKEVQNA